MSRKTDGQSKYFRKFEPTSTGVLRKIEEEKIFSINVLRISLQGECAVTVRAKTLNETTYTDLATISSTVSASEVVDVSTWDYVEYECISLSGTPVIYISGFFDIMNPIKELVIGRDYDVLDVTYPTTSTENYSYKLSGNEIRAVLVTYADDTKADLTKVEIV